MSTSNLKIAVCLYGQPRTWKYCKNFISEFYNVNAEVDFFVSTKNYNLHLRTNDNEVIYSNTDREIINYYKPKKYNIIPFEEEIKYQHFEDMRKDTSLYFTSFVDSIMLKQAYELEKKSFYNLVSMQRFDVIYQDVNYLKTFIEEFDYYKTNLICNPVFTFTNKFMFKKQKHVEEIDDNIILGSSVAMNMICSEIISYWNHDVKYSPFKKPKNSLKNGHVGIGIAMSKICNEKHYFNDTKQGKLNYTIVRETSDLELNPFDVSSFEAHNNHYIESFKI